MSISAKVVINIPEVIEMEDLLYFYNQDFERCVKYMIANGMMPDEYEILSIERSE